tara:strand:- start:603 stop:1727 length:1125 start_codon:yes stop_codon:yes gene_type:complete
LDHISFIYPTNFRNLDDQEINLDSLANIFIGLNGAGKTNIIETVSLLSPGKGLKKQSFNKISKFNSDKPWIILLKYIKNNSSIDIAVTYENNTKGSSLKKILINGEKQKKLLESDYIPTVIWFTPDMERLFMSPSSIRRDFLDRIVFSFDQNILSKIRSYKKLLKERYNIIQLNDYDLNWVKKIEENIATLGIEIIKKRGRSIEILNKMFSTDLLKININSCSIKLSGDFDQLVLKNKPEVSMEKFLCELENFRQEDKIKGSCKVGPHKSDIEITYLKNNTSATFCSTGQQKEIVLNILLCQVYCLVKFFNKKPIVLLDEVCSHLDDNTRSILLHLIEKLKTQVLMTGTDKKLFTFLSKKAKFFHVKNGIINLK